MKTLHAFPDGRWQSDRRSSGVTKAIHATACHEPSAFRMFSDTKVRAFTAKTYREPSYRFQSHYHPEWEIMFCRNGRGTRHVGGSVEKFGPGDLVMLPGKIPHTWFSSKSQTVPTCCTAIHFLPEVWGNAFWKLPEVQGFHALCQRALRGAQFKGEGIEEVGQRMETLAQNDTASIESLVELWKIFSLLTKLEMRSLNAVKEGNHGPQSARLGELLMWLESNLREPINQYEAAARVRMTPAAFSRWFKLNMGCVFKRYLNELRVARVCAEIAHRNMSITEAAYHAGYNNLSNFNRRFREVTGLTPRNFRAQLEGNVSKASPQGPER